MTIKSKLSLFLTLGALCATHLSHAQTPDFTVSTFDFQDESFFWTRWWGVAAELYVFDPDVDVNGNAASGSLKATIDFDRVANGGDNQFALIGAFPAGTVLDATLYTNLVFDIRWDSASPKRASGDFGSLEYGFRKSDFSQHWLAPPSPLNVPSTPVDGWIHVVAPINPAGAGIDQITGIVLKMWSGDPASGHIGTATFWLDNVKLIGKADTTTPQPTLAIEEGDPGLRIYASQGGAQYQRQNIRTLNSTYSWVGAPTPVTYSFTIKNYPDTNHTGFQTQLFLVPGDGIPNGESSPDWNRPNVIFLDLQNNAQGGAFASFRHKTNEANGNSMIYGAGTLAGIGSAQVLGTWSLTFSNDTNVTITTPLGTSTNFSIAAETAALFANPLYAFLGIQPNQVVNINESAAFSRFQISGIEPPVNETFAGVAPDLETRPNLDPELWVRSAGDVAGVVLVPPDVAFALNWTVPAVGFQLQSSTTLAPNSWTDSTFPATQIGERVRVMVPAGNLPGPGHAFFRLLKP